MSLSMLLRSRKEKVMETMRQSRTMMPRMLVTMLNENCLVRRLMKPETVRNIAPTPVIIMTIGAERKLGETRVNW